MMLRNAPKGAFSFANFLDNACKFCYYKDMEEIEAVNGYFQYKEARGKSIRDEQFTKLENENKILNNKIAEIENALNSLYNGDIDFESVISRIREQVFGKSHN